MFGANKSAQAFGSAKNPPAEPWWVHQDGATPAKNVVTGTFAGSEEEKMVHGIREMAKRLGVICDSGIIHTPAFKKVFSEYHRDKVSKAAEDLLGPAQTLCETVNPSPGVDLRPLPAYVAPSRGSGRATKRGGKRP